MCRMYAMQHGGEQANCAQFMIGECLKCEHFNDELNDSVSLTNYFSVNW